MNRIWLFLVCAAVVGGADFTSGQAARLVIGQETFTSQDTNSSDTLIGAASGLAYAGDTLFVADSNRAGATPLNHRVLLFQNLSTVLPAPTAAVPANSLCPICLGQATVVLGQPDFTSTTENVAASPNALRQPTAVASDGVHLVVADTNHNRVIIWSSIPTVNDQPADVVVGQPNFATAAPSGSSPTAKSMSGPEGVWIQNGKLYVADTNDNRVLIYNRIPTSNGAAADVVLGAPNFTTLFQPTLSQQSANASASNMLNPVSVTSDGVRLYVSDLGYNRVLIWNSSPTSNGAPANLAVGQPDFSSSIANNSFSGRAAANASDTANRESPVLCTTSTGADAAGNPIYPDLCNSTLSYPRFALSDGTRLFIADGGNDRVLVFNQIPTQNGAPADTVLGQTSCAVDEATDAADSLATPMSLAWDGTNLYVSDTYNRRILVYSVGADLIPYGGVRNGASFNVYSLGNVAIGGTITAGDSATITICGPPSQSANTTGCISPNAVSASTSGETIGTDYTYKVTSTDTLNTVVDALVSAINAGSGDPNAIAAPDHATSTVLLAARVAGPAGNNIAYTASVSANATLTTTAAGGTLTGGGDASEVAPGSIVSIFGVNLAPMTAFADMTQDQMPTTLGGAEVYFNGIRSPLFYVSPTQINAQIPWEVNNTTSINAYVRTVDSQGNVTATTPVAATIVTQNPGIFVAAGSTATPPPGVILHGSNSATGVVMVDGSITPGDQATVTIDGRPHVYTVQSGDTLDSVRDGLVAVVNQDPEVTAIAGIAFARNFSIQARVAGPDGNGIPYSTSIAGASSGTGGTLILTSETTGLCCANVAYSPVTNSNPAVPGEVLLLYATGLGLPALDDQNQNLINTGAKYPAGGPVTQPINFVSSLAGGKTANILSATLKPGTVGIFEVTMQLNSDMPSDPLTKVYIAQDVFISNVVTFPLVNPSDSASSATVSQARVLPRKPRPLYPRPGTATPAKFGTSAVGAAALRAGNAVSLNSASSDPLPATATPQPSDQAIAFNQDGVTVNGPATPADRGSAVSIDLGGEFADRSGKEPPLATVGGLPAVAEYVTADATQVKVQIPCSAPSGDRIPVVITFGQSMLARVNLAIR